MFTSNHSLTFHLKTNILYTLFFFLTVFPVNSSSQDIEYTELEPGLYIYRSYMEIGGQPISANGLIVESSDEVALIDTPWENVQTEKLLKWIETNIKKPVVFAVITHAHNDRIGGIDVLKTQNIPTIANKLTFEEAVKNNFSQPDLPFQTDTLLTFGSSSFEVFYPGPGHTPDNSVVYLKNHHVLYGGCFIKSAGSLSLGNLEDAVPSNWPTSLQRVVERYPERKVVVPGHGNWDDGAIERTLELLKNR